MASLQLTVTKPREIEKEKSKYKTDLNLNSQTSRGYSFPANSLRKLPTQELKLDDSSSEEEAPQNGTACLGCLRSVWGASGAH